MGGAPLVLLLLLLLIKHLSGETSPCLDSDLDLGEGDVKTFVTSPPGRSVIGQHLYIHYKEGFKGVDLKITGSNDVITMSFDVSRHCFSHPHPAYWWKMYISCGYLSGPNYAWCVMVGGDCRWHCNMKYTSEGEMDFSVVAHGPSAWREQPPDLKNCPQYMEWLWRNRYPADDQPCRNLAATQPPEPDTATPPNNSYVVTILVAVVVVAVVVGLGIAVLKMKLRRERQRQQRPPVSPPVATFPPRPPRQTPVALPKTEDNHYDYIYDDVMELTDAPSPRPVPFSRL